jgi:hypothetical protein
MRIGAPSRNTRSHLKSSIAMTVMTRQLTPAVRVEAGRVRGRLRQYYAEEGKGNRSLIDVVL